MANLSIAAVKSVRDILLEPGGLHERLQAIAFRDGVQIADLDPAHVYARHVPASIHDANVPSVYPAVFLYCSRMENRLERKFSEFSGRVFVIADVRSSGEDVDGLDGEAARIVEALTDTLADHHGKWTDELAFDGKYTVRFEPLEEAGVNFLQRAEIEIELLANA